MCPRLRELAKLIGPIQYGIDLASPTELIAHGKTRQEVAKLIGADDMVYQTLEDLQDACVEAAPEGDVKDFEVGVFNGVYKTPVPEGYFDMLCLNRGKKRKLFDDSRNGTLVGNGGPVNTVRGDNYDRDEHVATRRQPENREDIRYVLNILVLTNIELIQTYLVFTILHTHLKSNIYTQLLTTTQERELEQEAYIVEN